MLLGVLASSPLLVPAYRETVRFTAEIFLPTVLPAIAVENEGAAGWRIFEKLSDGTESKLLRIPSASLTEIYLGVLFLPALLLATPVPWIRRLRLVGWGLLLLLLVQSVLLVAFLAAWVHYQRSDPGDDFYTWLTLVHSVAGQLAALPIWAGLTWRHWFLPGSTAFPKRHLPAR